MSSKSENLEAFRRLANALATPNYVEHETLRQLTEVAAALAAQGVQLSEMSTMLHESSMSTLLWDTCRIVITARINEGRVYIVPTVDAGWVQPWVAPPAPQAPVIVRTAARAHSTRVVPPAPARLTKRYHAIVGVYAVVTVGLGALTGWIGLSAGAVVFALLFVGLIWLLSLGFKRMRSAFPLFRREIVYTGALLIGVGLGGHNTDGNVYWMALNAFIGLGCAVAFFKVRDRRRP